MFATCLLIEPCFVRRKVNWKRDIVFSAGGQSKKLGPLSDTAPVPCEVKALSLDEEIPVKGSVSRSLGVLED